MDEKLDGILAGLLGSQSYYQWCTAWLAASPLMPSLSARMTERVCGDPKLGEQSALWMAGLLFRGTWAGQRLTSWSTTSASAKSYIWDGNTTCNKGGQAGGQLSPSCLIGANSSAEKTLGLPLNKLNMSQQSCWWSVGQLHPGLDYYECGQPEKRFFPLTCHL